MAQDFIKDRAWGTNANWDSGTAPIDNDDVVIPDSLAVDVDTTIDQSLIDLNTLYITPGYTHDLGATGNANNLRIACDLVTHAGTGGLYIASSLGSAATKIDEIRVMCAKNSGICEIDSELSDAGDVDKILALRGQVTVKGTCLFGSSAIVEVGHIDDPLTDTSMTFETNSDTLPTFNQVSGQTNSKIAITTAHVSGGTLFQDSKLITTLHISGTGTVIYKHTALTTVHVRAGGKLDLTAFYQKDLTITDLFLWPGGIVYGHFTQGITPIEGPVIVTNYHALGGTVLPYNPTRRRVA